MIIFRWSGDIDDVRYYVKALNGVEIKAVYDEIVGPDPGTINIGLNWAFMGDSQTHGRAYESPAVVSSPQAVETIWNSLFPNELPNLTNRGWGSHSLLMSWKEGWGYCYNAIDNTDKNALTWVHFQESGTIAKDSQRNLSEYTKTLDGFINDIRLYSPNAFITAETAFSYGRENECNGCVDWSAYNDHLRLKISGLKAQNVNILLVDIDRLIKYGQSSEGFGSPDLLWFPANSDTFPYHYTGLGNFLIALAIYDALGYDITDWGDKLSEIPNAQISESQKTLSINIVKNYLTTNE